MQSASMSLVDVLRNGLCDWVRENEAHEVGLPRLASVEEDSLELSFYRVQA